MYTFVVLHTLAIVSFLVHGNLTTFTECDIVIHAILVITVDSLSPPSLPPSPSPSISQDQYDKVAIHTDIGIEFVKRVSSFVEKRISAEHNYAKELRRLAKSFRKKEDEESQ